MQKKYIFLILILLFIDQLTKYLVVTNMDLYQEIVIIKNFFSLYFVYNTGAAFSILEGNIYFLYLVSVFALAYMVYYYKKHTDIYTRYSIAILIAGTLGNFIDRLYQQKVIDFLSFTFFGWRFAIFNIADIFVFVGILLLMIDIYKIERRSKNDNI